MTAELAQGARWGTRWWLWTPSVSRRGQVRWGFNPLDLIDTRGEDYVETAMMMAEMLIVKTGSGDPHWVLEAKALLYTFILHAASKRQAGGAQPY